MYCKRAKEKEQFSCFSPKIVNSYIGISIIYPGGGGQRALHPRPGQAVGSLHRVRGHGPGSGRQEEGLQAAKVRNR